MKYLTNHVKIEFQNIEICLRLSLLNKKDLKVDFIRKIRKCSSAR